MTTTVITKPTAIVYCRLSRVGDTGVMSLDSQEFAIKRWLEENNIGVFKALKEVGSAYCRFKQRNNSSDLRRVLSSCKDKTLVVFEANRLSRNTANFREIYNLCVKNRHSIAIVNLNIIFDYRIRSNYEILFDLIARAQEESAAMGRRISRTAAYKKSRETQWGKMRNEHDEIVDNPNELKISNLITLLSTRGSAVNQIKNLVEELKTVADAEPFELVDCEEGKEDKEIGRILPVGMSAKNIEETFKIYGIRKRRARWSAKDIVAILRKEPIINNDFTLDNLVDSMSVSRLNTPQPPRIVEGCQEEKREVEWVAVWYSPITGIPPNVVIPEGMILPTTPTMIYLPKN